MAKSDTRYMGGWVGGIDMSTSRGVSGLHATKRRCRIQLPGYAKTLIVNVPFRYEDYEETLYMRPIRGVASVRSFSLLCFIQIVGKEETSTFNVKLRYWNYGAIVGLQRRNRPPVLRRMNSRYACDWRAVMNSDPATRA